MKISSISLLKVMIKKSGRDISFVNYGRISITAIAHAGVKIWESIRSCFGRGWYDQKPWIDNEGWS